MSSLRSAATLLIALMGLWAANVMAGATYIYEMSSVSETGYGGAGIVARANDAGTVFSNPAGMTRFNESELLAGASLTYISSKFNPDQTNEVDGKTNSVGVPMLPDQPDGKLTISDTDFSTQGNLPVKDTKGVSGHYHKTSISFLSFYAMWHQIFAIKQEVQQWKVN